MLGSGVRVASFPNDDEAFAACVDGCCNELGLDERSDPLELQCRLRRQYRFAVVREQVGPGPLGPPTWHVYRDVKPSPKPDSGWWAAPSTARVMFDTGWTVVEADAAAAALVGLDSATLAGKTWWEILPPAARVRVASSLGALGTREWVQSEFDCPLPDGRWRAIEYRVGRAPAPDRFVSFWRRSSPDLPGRAALPEPGPRPAYPARRIQW